MNQIDYNQAMSALEKECQLLLNREQYGAENVLVEHALNVISELPVIRQPEIVRCKDCKNVCLCDTSEILPGIPIYAKCTLTDKVHKPDWFCADGVMKGENE